MLESVEQAVAAERSRLEDQTMTEIEEFSFQLSERTEEVDCLRRELANLRDKEAGDGDDVDGLRKQLAEMQTLHLQQALRLHEEFEVFARCLLLTAPCSLRTAC